MADDTTLTPERLSELLARLDEVMEEAVRLRGQITRQLSEQHRDQRHNVKAPRRRRKKT